MKAILLVNLGTPKSFQPNDVGDFLSEFLMDPALIELPYFLRWLLVEKMIVPKRKYASAKNYEKIWMKEGSPLMHYSQALLKELKSYTSNQQIHLAMRYGQPSIVSEMKKIKDQGVTELLVVPLFPQYSTVTSLSVIKEVQKVNQQMNFNFKLKFIEEFAADPSFIKPLVGVSKNFLDASKKVDHFLLSFHGLPEKILKKHDPVGNHCLKCSNCCDKKGLNQKKCYRSQCLQTAQSFAKAYGLPDSMWTMSFQSRLGRAKWTGPYTQDKVVELASSGVKNLAVVSPSFVSDCLETLEEIDMGLREDFLNAGGEQFHLVPCLNANPLWTSSLGDFLNAHV